MLLNPPRLARIWACVGGLLALVACDVVGPKPAVLRPDPPRGQVPEPVLPSPASADLMHYYQALEQDLLTRGLLRTDGGGPDTRYTADTLVRNFEAIAFFDEYVRGTSGSQGAMGRWETTVRIQTEFGPTVPASIQQLDSVAVTDYANRLAQLTRHPITTVGGRGNFHVLIAGKDDSAFVIERVKQILPDISAEDLAIFANPPRTFYCLVFAGGPQGTPFSYTKGVALIRAEHPDLVRRSCLHEEIAQGLGLRNDSPWARPSIFNDDDEFALLTSHDEKLLTMLYDDRLRPGMSADEARPILRVIANELMGQPL